MVRPSLYPLPSTDPCHPLSPIVTPGPYERRPVTCSSHRKGAYGRVPFLTQQKSGLANVRDGLLENSGIQATHTYPVFRTRFRIRLPAGPPPEYR
jgi:hypothetical protein